MLRHWCELRLPTRVPVGAALLCAVLALGAAARAVAGEHDLLTRGEYLLRAGGCVSCHTDVKGGGRPLAGGRALKTPFGVFYSPNITPDEETGIGAWSDADFARALRHGIRPDGAHYFPAFPYTSYTHMRAADVVALNAYLFSRPPVRSPVPPHELRPPFAWRFLVGAWKLLFFEPGPLQPDPGRSKRWNRGAYLVEALAHCGECHTPRNALGALDREMWLAGTAQGPEGRLAPNITPHRATGIGDWSAADLVRLLSTGRKANFDTVQGAMAEAIDEGLKHLSDEDLAAIADYVLSFTPIRHRVERKRP